ncbi:Endolytic murein transglycosylase [Rhodanobacter lindaniclasticus]
MDRVVKGESGIGPVVHFDTSAYSTRIAGQVSGFDPAEWMPLKDVKKMDPFIHYGVAAGTQALRDSGLEITEANAPRVGVAVGAGIGGLYTIELTTLELAAKGAAPRVAVLCAQLDHQHGLGPALHHVRPEGAEHRRALTAYSTGAHNIGLAARMIQYGDADAMIAGGAEFATTGTAMAGLCSAKAMSTRNDEPTKASRPWDKDRDGFVLSDGAGVVMLEEYEHARARGARIYAELVGFGMSGDAFHMTAPSEGGEGAARCIQTALNDAGLNPADVQYVNAHGTSTPLGDLGEVMAAKKVFGYYAYKLAMSSTKSTTGHLLGAAGGVEAIFSVLALRDQVLPPTINLDEPGEGCDLDFVPNVAGAKRNSTWRCPTRSASAAPTARWRSAAFDRRRRGLPSAPTGRPARPARAGGGAAGALSRPAGKRAARHRPLSRHDILFAFPGERLELAADGQLRDGSGQAQVGRFLDALDQAWLAQRRPAADDGLPFHGGWVLLLSYELAGEIEPRLKLSPPADLPLALAIRCPAAVIVDHANDCTWLVAEAGHEHLLDLLEADLAQPAAWPSLPALLACEEDPPGEFLDGVARIHEHLHAGDIFQVNLSRGWNARYAQRPAPAALYDALRRANPAPFAGLLQQPDWAVLSSSPERLVEVRGGVAQTRPIAGTRPRLSGDDEIARIRELSAHPKERAEHVMLETYAYVKGDSELDVLRRAHTAMERTLAAAWAGRAPDLQRYAVPGPDPGLDRGEGNRPCQRACEDCRGVGRRLESHMLLQTDPSVIYGMGARYDGNITSNLATDTPYNTYTRAGLPPTPIALPGKPAIEAALHPAAGDALYFVARGDGSHVFSSSLAEHNRNVDCYQRKRCR